MQANIHDSLLRRVVNDRTETAVVNVDSTAGMFVDDAGTPTTTDDSATSPSSERDKCNNDLGSVM